MRPLVQGRQWGIQVCNRSLVALLLIAGVSGSLVMPLHAKASDVTLEKRDENVSSSVQMRREQDSSTLSSDVPTVGDGGPINDASLDDSDIVVSSEANGSAQAVEEAISVSASSAVANAAADEVGGSAFRSMAAMNLRSAHALSCEDNTMYGLTASGNMRRLSIDPNTGQVGATSVDGISFNIDAIAEPETSFNGLAIGNNGQLAYALTRRPPLPAGSNIAPERALQLYMWSSSTNRVQRLWGTFDIGNYGAKIPNA